MLQFSSKTFCFSGPNKKQKKLYQHDCRLQVPRSTMYRWKQSKGKSKGTDNDHSSYSLGLLQDGGSNGSAFSYEAECEHVANETESDRNVNFGNQSDSGEIVDTDGTDICSDSDIDCDTNKLSFSSDSSIMSSASSSFSEDCSSLCNSDDEAHSPKEYRISKEMEILTCFIKQNLSVKACNNILKFMEGNLTHAKLLAECPQTSFTEFHYLFIYYLL